MRGVHLILLAGLLGAATSYSQELRHRLESYVEQNQRDIVTELRQALSIPDVASDEENIRKKAAFLQERFRARGFDAELLETDGNPLVWAELRASGATERTLLLYCHYDGQPVDPTRWEQPDPFVPVLRDGKLEDGGSIIDFDARTELDDDWRIYGRSSSDDTGPIIALLAAVDALKAAGIEPSAKVRVILDGEEEAGSPNLAPAIGRFRDKLEADLMLVLDGPLHQSGKPTVVYGARGILTLELTVYGPRVPLHSGHYGNWAPNPAMRLARLLASMKDDGGRVLIEGFYEGIEIGPDERTVLDSVPDDLEELKRFLGFSEAEEVGDTLQEAIQYPSLNVRGLLSAWVGSEARTIVPDQAIAAVDVRLVKETDADAMYEKIRRHIEAQGYHIVAEDPDDATRAARGRIVRVRRSAGSNAYRTELDNPEAVRMVEAITEMWGEPPVRKRTSGGTVPIAQFINELGFPALNVPTVNFDNNQHSPNENLRLGHFFDSIVTIAAILTAY
ncbi:MAG TPA: M20/M25/M40 family metallo-hydrolase [Vicinamibacteria bacterium]|nr:M20/M25/M40 family metallo-hydrolase [Vicinamibacteria bacterium]